MKETTMDNNESNNAIPIEALHIHSEATINNNNIESPQINSEATNIKIESSYTISDLVYLY